MTITNTVESRFLEPSVSRTSRYLEPNLVSLGFALLKLYNSTPNFSNPWFLETPDNSNQFWLPWDKLTLDNSNLRKYPNSLVRMSITFTPLNKLAVPDKLFSCILITQQASHKYVISLKSKMTDSDYQHSLNWAMQSACLAHSAFSLMMHTSIICTKVSGPFLKSQTRVSCLQRGNKLFQIISAKLSERSIQTQHDMCSVMFRFCDYVLLANKAQYLL